MESKKVTAEFAALNAELMVMDIPPSRIIGDKHSKRPRVFLHKLSLIPERPDPDRGTSRPFPV